MKFYHINTEWRLINTEWRLINTDVWLLTHWMKSRKWLSWLSEAWMILSLSVCLALSQAYTLKDYKQLKSDIVLSRLGPDYKSIEKTVSTDHHCCLFALEPKRHQVSLVFKQITLWNSHISFEGKHTRTWGEGNVRFWGENLNLIHHFVWWLVLIQMFKLL